MYGKIYVCLVKFLKNEHPELWASIWELTCQLESLKKEGEEAQKYAQKMEDVKAACCAAMPERPLFEPKEVYGDHINDLLLVATGLVVVAARGARSYPFSQCLLARVAAGDVPEEAQVAARAAAYRWGTYFVHDSVASGGMWEKLVKMLGNNTSELLHNMDWFHASLRPTYPHMCSPTFHITHEDKHGLQLRYSTVRPVTYLQHYTMGLIEAVADTMFHQDVRVRAVGQGGGDDGLNYADMEVKFDNTDCTAVRKERHNGQLPFAPKLDFLLRGETFHIAFDGDMKIITIGSALAGHLGVGVCELQGDPLEDHFTVQLPHLSKPVTSQQVKTHDRVPFTLVCDGQNAKGKYATGTVLPLELRGEMMLLGKKDGRDMFVFRGCVRATGGFAELEELGLYTSDFPRDGLHREAIFVGSQISTQLNEQIKKIGEMNAALAVLTAQCEAEKREREALVGRLVGHDHVRHALLSRTTHRTLKNFQSVSVMFILLEKNPEDLDDKKPLRVRMKNYTERFSEMVEIIDTLIENNEQHVNLVELTNDTYIVSSGAPNRVEGHASHIVNLAIDIRKKLLQAKDKNIKFRIGIHSGAIMGGVLSGTELPRYRLVGPTINMAQRMMANSEKNKILISEETKKLLPKGEYSLKKRDLIDVKGVTAKVQTFWVCKQQDPNTGSALLSRRGSAASVSFSFAKTAYGKQTDARTSRRSSTSTVSSFATSGAVRKNSLGCSRSSVACQSKPESTSKAVSPCTSVFSCPFAGQIMTLPKMPHAEGVLFKRNAKLPPHAANSKHSIPHHNKNRKQKITTGYMMPHTPQGHSNRKGVKDLTHRTVKARPKTAKYTTSSWPLTATLTSSLNFDDLGKWSRGQHSYEKMAMMGQASAKSHGMLSVM